MAERGDPQVLKHVVIYLLTEAGMVQEKFAQATGTTQAHVSNYVRGQTAPPNATLRRMARVAHVPWHVVQHHIRFLTAVKEAVECGSAAGAAAFDHAVLDNVLLAVMPYLVEEEAAPLALGEALREAEEILAILEPLPQEERRRRIGTAPPGACRSWAALVKVVGEASVRAAADNAERALELADLAFPIAERVPREESAAARAYGLGYLGNARRVANDFDKADEALARARELWRAGSPWFPEWRLLSLEASLRRAQHRFPEALARLEEAGASSAGDPLAAGQILLKRSNVLEQMDDLEGALAALEEAAPLLEGTDEPRLLAVLCFNRTDVLVRLERCEEAARLLPEVRRLAAEQANGLDQTRVAWLTAKVKAGTGNQEEAMADLERVRDAFADDELPYDAALADLDLAVLRLGAGRTAEVREQAENMAWIFVSKKIDREALAALNLFCDAAKQEAATVELARRVIAEVEKARRAGPPPAK
ncbi:MAG: helix-turn-helix domain-containing protein [Thermoanaerobaculia bacterium]